MNVSVAPGARLTTCQVITVFVAFGVPPPVIVVGTTVKPAGSVSTTGPVMGSRPCCSPDAVVDQIPGSTSDPIGEAPRSCPASGSRCGCSSRSP